MKIKTQKEIIENLAEEIENNLGEEFYQELRYIGVEKIDLDHFTLDCEVRGGFDSSCNAAWGGEDYLSEITEYITEKYDQVTNVSFTIDDEELNGVITVEV
ncbi:MAG: hypothetical protein IJH63_00860 [Methanobrevibacter sp.]|nr:hypothetical protein [Methanosphaera sp.]MBR0369255.1 hypothetical protein [Methanobrevibacter sp.]